MNLRTKGKLKQIFTCQICGGTNNDKNVCVQYDCPIEGIKIKIINNEKMRNLKSEKDMLFKLVEIYKNRLKTVTGLLAIEIKKMSGVK